MAHASAPRGRARIGGTAMASAGGGIVWRVAGLLLLCAASIALAPAVTATTLTGRAPTATDDTGYSTSSGAPVVPLTAAAPGLLANDLDPDTPLASLTAIKVTDPANGTVTVNANGGFVYTPTANFAGTDSFTYKVNDGTSDSNVATVTITVVAPPVVTSTTPTNGATSVLASTTITVNFSVAVNVTATAFMLECPAGTPRSFALAPAPPGGVASYTLTPGSALPSGATCTVTVVASQVTNAATGTAMASNYAFSFTVDTPPVVTTTTPANNATNVLTNATITVNFDKAVNATTASFTLECPSPTGKTFALSPAGPATAYVLTPTGGLPAGTVCTVTVVAAQVTDVAGTKMAANVVFSFTTDAPPVVTTTTPTNGAINVLTAATITVNFDRSVNVTASAFTLECPAGTPQTFTVSPASPASSYVLTPSVRLPASTVCTVTVVASQVTSAATGTAMAANVVVTFTTDTPPTVTTTTPANNAINVAAGSTITVNFSKSVNASLSSFTLECPTGTPKTFTLAPAGPATAYVLTPSGGLPSDTACTLTVVAAQVTDVPGEPMAANYVFSFATPPLAVNDTYPQTVIGNVSINSAQIPYSATTNDTVNLAVTITAFDAVSAQGGTVTITTSGTGLGQFTYNPPAGYTGTDTFTYTISNAHGSSTGTVSLTVAGTIWFIDANAATNGDGRLSSPFNNLASFNAVNNGTGNNPAANDNIFLYESGTTYASGVTLLSGQKLIGQDATQSLTTITGLTPGSGSVALPAMNSGNGTKTIIGGTVTLANTVTVRGLTVSSGGATAVTGTSITTATVGADVAITTTSGIGVSLNGGNGAIDTGATVTTTSGRAVQVQNRTGGTTTFSGAISDGGGILLTSHTNATITFTGGVAVSSGGNAAFTATGGGTVNVCDKTACATGSAVVNTLTTTTATALNVTNTTIGASGLTFRSISSNGAANGITLNNTGASGGLTVTGNGGTCTSVGTCTGGTIQNATVGVSLSNATNVSIDRMFIQNTTSSGIKGSNNVVNFSFTNGKIDNSGTGLGVDDSNIGFNTTGTGTEKNLTGTVTITGNTLTNAYYHGVDIFDYDGTISNATISNNTITSSAVVTASKGSGIRFVAFGGPSTVANITKATLDNNDITNFPSGVGLQVQGGNANSTSAPAGTYGTLGSGTNIIAITNNVITGQSAANRIGGEGMVVLVNGRGQGNFNISGNTISNTAGQAISHSAFGLATVTSTISNNTIVANNTVASPGIGVGTSKAFAASDTPSMTTTITNNNVSQSDGNGILVVARDATGMVNVKIQNNTVAAPLSGFRPGIRVDSGNSSSADETVCLNISGNTSAGSGSQPGLGLRKQGTAPATNTFGVNGMAATSSPGVEAYVNGLNPAGNGTLLISATSGFTNCTLNAADTPDLNQVPPAGDGGITPAATVSLEAVRREDAA